MNISGELRSALGSTSDDEIVREHEGIVVVSPRSAEEVAALLRFANGYKLGVEVVGASTKRGWCDSVKADIVLETSKLAGLREHSWQDLTATVGAGTTWAVMRRALSQHNQQVALDPLWADKATVGGIIAANDSGALRLKYGGLRDLIIGMTIVLADGTIARSGGKVVKNVAGYDLHKLMTGGFGTLGVITEVTFRLYPVPSLWKIWTICCDTAEATGELMLRVLDSQLSTEAMQLRAGPDGYALDVAIATLPAASARQIEMLSQFAVGSSKAKPSVCDDDGVFGLREHLFDQGKTVVFKGTMLPSAVAKVSAEVVEAGGSAVTQATGIMLAQIPEANAMSALASLRATVEEFGGGSLTILRSGERLTVWGDTRSAGERRAFELMREIKRRLDPGGTLNPGLLPGGMRG